MGFSGTPVPIQSGALGTPFRNYLILDGLFLLPLTNFPADPANADCGELTTSLTPTASQTQIPTSWTGGLRAPGQWLAGDENSVVPLDVKRVSPDGEIGMHSVVRGYPQVVAGNLVIRYVNLGTATGPLRLTLLFLHSLIQ